MLRNDRPVDQNFRGYHRLYYRCQPGEVIGGNRLAPLAIRSFDASVNWSKYSKPWDVIYGHPHAGIAFFFVWEVRRDLPTELPQTKAELKNQPKVRSFLPFHVPYDDNYGHCEIRVMRDGIKATKSSHISEEAKKEFRQIVSDRIRVIRHPAAVLG